MDQSSFTKKLLPEIEKELQQRIACLNTPPTSHFHEMMSFHFGWTEEKNDQESRGKRVRPLLVLLTTSSCGANWKPALPAAAAIELVHNFSLVHDDIQDNSIIRHNRPTVWKKWGMPQGINVGDALFVLANMTLLDLSRTYPSELVTRIATILNSTCLDLTRGQFLDMSFESMNIIQMGDYWSMIEGKTAALIAASCEIGSLLGGADMEKQRIYRDFGHYLGLAFQVQDDLLGIWGETRLTGKSIESDLIARKKTLPILYGFEKSQEFMEFWSEGSIKPGDVPFMTKLLDECGAHILTREICDHLTEMALQTLRQANPSGEAGDGIFELVNALRSRLA